MLKYTIYECVRCDAQPLLIHFGPCTEDPCPICKDIPVEEHIVEEDIDTLPLLIAYNQRTGHYNTRASAVHIP